MIKANIFSGLFEGGGNYLERITFASLHFPFFFLQSTSVTAALNSSCRFSRTASSVFEYIMLMSAFSPKEILYVEQ